MKLITVFLFVSFTFGLSLSAGLPEDCNCRLNVKPRIVDGKDSQVIPWQVSVQSDSHMCSGIILDGDSVITIQSCVTGHAPEELKIVTGINRLDQANTNNTYTVKSINFPADSADQPTNIAVLKLKNQIKFEKGLAEKACIRMYDSDYSRKWIFFAQKFLVTGFGYTKTFETDINGNHEVLKPSNILKKVDLTIDYKRTNDNDIRTKPNRLAAIFFGKSPSVCVYDEGSPLMLLEKGRHLVVAMSDDMEVTEIKDTQKFKVCDGHGTFIKFTSTDSFLKTLDTSKMCLERKD